MNLEEGMPHPSAVGDKEGAFVDQGYTSEQARHAAQEAGLEWVVVKLAEATKGLILLPRRWVVKRGFGWTIRSRRLVRAYECTRGPGGVAFCGFCHAHAGPAPTLHRGSAVNVHGTP